jgi:protein required for attachment to host cells
MPIAVIVADAGRAKILSAEMTDAPLSESEDLVHPESRLREQDLVADGYGSGRDSGGFGKHSMGHEKEAHARQASIFASEVCARIDQIRRRDKLHRIYLIAAPGFLGLLRDKLNRQCLTLVSGEVGKNLVTHSLSDIRAHLPKRL